MTGSAFNPKLGAVSLRSDKYLLWQLLLFCQVKGHQKGEFLPWITRTSLTTKSFESWREDKSYFLIPKVWKINPKLSSCWYTAAGQGRIQCDSRCLFPLMLWFISSSSCLLVTVPLLARLKWLWDVNISQSVTTFGRTSIRCTLMVPGGWILMPMLIHWLYAWFLQVHICKLA